MNETDYQQKVLFWSCSGTAVLFLESNHSPAVNTGGLLQQIVAAQGIGEPPLLFPPGQGAPLQSGCHMPCTGFFQALFCTGVTVQ